MTTDPTFGPPGVGWPVFRGDLPEAEKPQNPVAWAMAEDSNDATKAAAAYRPDPGLTRAVNVALLLGQPLLLTGEPGTGKTQLAYRVAYELGLEPVQRFDTKSTSSARDLFYVFDHLRRYHAAHRAGGEVDNRDFLEFNALGRAFLLANAREQVVWAMPPGAEDVDALMAGAPRRSVVLIDEIDKAPREFPNDLLHEIEAMKVRIPELGNRELAARAALRPVVIITSNSERNLPAPFLRRCLYYHLPFPDRNQLAEILRLRFPSLAGGDGSFVRSSVDLFLGLRAAGLHKAPSTAELIRWMRVLEPWFGLGDVRQVPREVLEGSFVVLIKFKEDLEAGAGYLKGLLEAGVATAAEPPRSA